MSEGDLNDLVRFLHKYLPERLYEDWTDIPQTEGWELLSDKETRSLDDTGKPLPVVVRQKETGRIYSIRPTVTIRRVHNRPQVLVKPLEGLL